MLDQLANDLKSIFTKLGDSFLAMFATIFTGIGTNVSSECK